jgi:hypothetical protein
MRHSGKTANLSTGTSRPKWLAALSLGLLTAGCGPSELYPELPPMTPEQYEYANMSSSNVIPKSSPAAFEKAFDSFCLAGGSSFASISAKLRKSDYIAAPKRVQNQQTAFVVDDKRPMVVLSDDGRFCAVVAQSRAGQSARIQRFISARFPKARPLPPAENYELMVETNSTPAGLVALKRLPSVTDGSRLVLAIHRKN